ncbi:MAG: VOC family protein [Clostridia bacterium]
MSTRSPQTDVDTVCAQLRGKGVPVLTGPVDRRWGNRTASFADPGRHLYEIASKQSA